ncbi:MAG: metallopeptidase TldD-related protein [Leptospirales bacterium]
MNSIEPYLKNRTELKAWQIEMQEVHSEEIYMVSNKTEAIRNTSVTRNTVGVFLDQKENEKDSMGESSVRFDGMPDTWKEDIDGAIESASYIKNPAYELSEKWLPEKEKTRYTYDASIHKNAQELIFKIEETARRFCEKHKKRTSLSYLETHFKTRHRRLSNSKGLDLLYPQSEVLYDFSLLSQDREHEIQVFMTRNFFQDLPLYKLLEDEAAKLEQIVTAVLPPTGNFSVVLAEEALDTLFDFHIYQLSGEALFQDISIWKEKDDIYDGKKPVEQLNLSTSPEFQGCSGSICCDLLGYETKPVDLITDGVVTNFAIDGKYSHLLQKQITSGYTNTIVGSGETAYEDFFTNGTIELLRFSTFSPDPISGNFSGEIRLGFIHKNGKRIPIRQGSVTGNIKDGLLTCNYSKERVRRQNYIGPAGVHFESLTLAGDV